MKARKVKHNGKEQWKVERTSNGKRQRKYFSSKTKATIWITKEEDKVTTLGREIARSADDEFVRRAVALQKKLDPYEKSLTDAVDHYVQYMEALGHSKTLSELVDAFVTTKKKAKKRERYIGELNSRLGKLKEHFGEDSKIATIDGEQAEAWLDGLEVGEQTRNHYRRVSHTFFQWAVRKKATAVNPFTAIEKANIERDDPGIFTPAQMGTLIKEAKGNSELTAWIALGAYAGLRPAEIIRLTWDRIHFDRGVIDLSVKGSKGAKRRLVEMRSALIDTLEPVRELGGAIVGRWFESSKTLQDLKKTLKFEWPHDGLRHSFGTYHLAAFEDAAKTALQMGHSNSSMLFAHYNQPGIDKATAYRYWGEKMPRKTAKRKTAKKA